MDPAEVFFAALGIKEMFGMAGMMGNGRPGAREGVLTSFNSWEDCTEWSTADKGVVGRVESSADDARDVKDVSTDVVTVAGPSGRFTSTRDGCTSSKFSSTSEPALSRCGNSTGTPVDCGAGFLRRVVTLLGGKEPSVKEYHGSC